MIRPERVRIEPQGTAGENRLPGLVEHLVFLGSFREVRVRLLGGALVTAIQPNDGDTPPYEQGSSVSVHMPVESLRVLPEAPAAGSRGRGSARARGRGSADRLSSRVRRARARRWRRPRLAAARPAPAASTCDIGGAAARARRRASWRTRR